MRLRSELELANTRQKLRELEDRFEELRNDAAEDPHVREVTLRSLKRVINQLKEQITLFEVHRQETRTG